jgi:glucose 1-dehydrogenase
MTVDLPEPDVVIECTGAPPIVLDVIRRNSPSGVVCLTACPAEDELKVDVGTASAT